MKIDPRLSEIKDCLYRLSARAVIARDGKLLFSQEADYKWWTTPGGGIEYGESVTDGLRRELVEELGIKPEFIKIDNHVLYVANAGVVNNVPRLNIYYRVELPVEDIHINDELLNLEWCSLEDANKLYLNPSLGDIKEIFEAAKLKLVE